MNIVDYIELVNIFTLDKLVNCGIMEYGRSIKQELTCKRRIECITSNKEMYC